VAVTTKRRAPKVRCYKCGSSTVRGLCHHCWRPGCAYHVRPSPGWAAWLFRAEGSGPGLKKVRARHCTDCAHVRVGRSLETGAAGVALMVVGSLAIPVSLFAGLCLIVVGGLATAVAYARIRRRSARARADLPVLLHPKVSDVRLVERIQTHITLGPQGDYKTRLEPVEGKLTATVTFGSHDRDRVDAHVRKRRLAPDQKVQYSAGCLVPQGRVGIKELDADPVVRVDGNARDIPAFRQEDPPASSRHHLVRKYRLSADPDIDFGPFWVVPSIAPESQRHVLEVDIQWTEFGPDDREPLTLEVIELLSITVPVSWGRVQGFSRGPVMISPSYAPDDGEGFQTLEWKQLSPEHVEREARQLTIAVQFENPVLGEDDHLGRREADLSGRFEATMNGSLSGADGIRMYNALGAHRTVSGVPSVKTLVEADFKLSLTSVRYQAVRVFPEHADEDIDRDQYAANFDAIPDDETVIALTNALAENEFYVKRVTENPPRSGGQADVMHRYWTIAGRSYQSVHPVDFHVVLTGEEVHRGDVRPDSGTTKIRIVVRGAYTDDEMRARVDNEWTRIRAVTEEALKGRASPGRGQGRAEGNG
jgi:hypothetical protein